MKAYLCFAIKPAFVRKSLEQVWQFKLKKDCLSWKMCGRFALNLRCDDLVYELNQLGVDLAATQGPERKGLNIAPYSSTAVVRGCCSSDNVQTGANILEYMDWGLIPSFARTAPKYATFNCREESLREQRSTWRCGVRRRLIVPMQGYYEWKEEASSKMPYYISSQKGELLCALGIWDVNEHIKKCLHSFTIVTTFSKGNLTQIHSRMPAFIDWADINSWIHGEWPDVLNLIRSVDLNFHRVSRDINKIGVEHPRLNEPIAENQSKIYFYNGKMKLLKVPQSNKTNHSNDECKSDETIDHEEYSHLSGKRHIRFEKLVGQERSNSGTKRRRKVARNRANMIQNLEN